MPARTPSSAAQRRLAEQRRLQAEPPARRRRRGVQLRAAVEGCQPVSHRLRRQVRVFRLYGHGGPARHDREDRRVHGALHAEAPVRAVPGRPGDGFRLDPVEGIRRRAGPPRPARADRPSPDRHRSIPARAVPAGFHDPLRGVRALLGGEAEAPRAGVRDHPRPGRAPGQAARRRLPGCRFSQCRRPGRDPGGPQAATAEPAGAGCRLYRVQHGEEAVRRRARAHRAQPGDRPQGDSGRRLSGRRHPSHHPAAADHVGVRCRRAGVPPRSRPRRRRCWPMPATRMGS